MLRFIVGLLTGLVLAIVLPLVLIGAGVFDMSARGGPGFLEQVVSSWSMERWVERGAPVEVVSAPPTTESWERGFALYRQSCVQCHGAPGVEPSEWAKHMTPPAPD